MLGFGQGAWVGSVLVRRRGSCVGEGCLGFGGVLGSWGGCLGIGCVKGGAWGCAWVAGEGSVRLGLGCRGGVEDTS